MNKSVELEREEGDETSSNVELPCGLRDLPAPRPPAAPQVCGSCSTWPVANGHQLSASHKPTLNSDELGMDMQGGRNLINQELCLL